MLSKSLPAVLLAVAMGALLNASSALAADTAAVAEQPAPKTSLLVADLENNGVDEETARTLSALLASEISNRYPDLEVVSGGELRSMLDIEAEKQSAGCETDASCLVELAEALGAELYVVGRVGRLGKRLVLNLTLMDARRAKALSRVTVKSDTVDDVPAALRKEIPVLLEPLDLRARREKGLMDKLSVADVAPWVATGTAGTVTIVATGFAIWGWWSYFNLGAALDELEEARRSDGDIGALYTAKAAAVRADNVYEAASYGQILGSAVAVIGAGATAASMGWLAFTLADGE